MIQIIQEKRKPSFGEKFSNAMGAGIQGANQIANDYMQKQAISNALGAGAENLPLEFQKMAYEYDLKNKNKAHELQGATLEDEKNYKTIQDTFGKKFADVWQSAPQGGKTELLKNALEYSSRGFDIDQMLSGHEEPTETEAPNIYEAKLKNGNIPKDYQWPDFSQRPRGYTPKDWNDERRHWRQENAPIFEKNKMQVKNNARDALGIKKLGKLNNSEKMPENFERLLINPETNDFYGIAQLAELVSPEAQEWVKEIARFQNRAKDAFGSRVTNFDLQSYMKQFPGLLNTKDGRERILKMMTINNKLDSLYENNLQKVYQKYGLAGIPQEKADELVRSLISDEVDKLENEFLRLDEENLDSTPEKLSGRMVDVRGPDGNIYELDESEVDQLPEGYLVI